MKALSEFLWSLHDAKMFIEHSSSVSPDALHMLTGCVLLVLLALTLRRPLSSLRPWAGTFALLLLNEALDLWVEQWPSMAMQLGESAKDLWITMAVPTAIMLTARFAPALYVGHGNPDGRPDQAAIGS
ncbi:hypothetical protein G7078_06185 [Sphingomonas sinipercae]|uniref:Uncharacterized protein n=1 Tax=Sphingomonas sinipercae TaxID=2714944 RepID=A0A6G7ZNB7_9SPHN|nr:hypothetical protein [Sphingomonas sinipercae]QIL02418.1 hypothetical protein G7078_06185 [Sphingomonas sinipercae]